MTRTSDVKEMLIGVFIVIVGLGGSLVFADFMREEPRHNIVGEYGCVGAGPDGKTYEVNLSVEKIGDGYGLTWSTEAGTTGIGVGIIKGDVLTAIFQTQEALGLVAYTISKNGLDGIWTVPQLEGVLMPEKCSIGSGPAKAA